MNRTTGWQPNPQAMAAAHAAKDNDTWLTPRFILLQLGTFDLDPCAASQNPTWCCDKYFTKETDGLRSEWSGRVFMNPPFSNTIPWLVKHCEHGKGISLVPASVESRVRRSHVWPKAKQILLLYGRTRFCRPDGSIKTGRPLRSVVLIAWGDADAAILERSSFAGVLLRDWRQQ